MKTFHEKLIQAWTESYLLSNDGGGRVLAECLKMMRDRQYSDLDSIHQRSAHLEHTIYDAYAFCQMRILVASSDVLRFTIDVGCEPSSDCQIDLNNAALSDLPVPFTAVFRPEAGRGAKSDGHLKWDKKIMAFAYDGTGIQVDPISVPLEVGTTLASRTLVHVYQDRGVARWPYGSDKIYVFLNRYELETFGQMRPWPKRTAPPKNLSPIPPQDPDALPAMPRSGRKFSFSADRVAQIIRPKT